MVRVQPGEPDEGPLTCTRRSEALYRSCLHAPLWSDPSLLDIDGLTRTTQEDADTLDAAFTDAVETALQRLTGLVADEDAAMISRSVQAIRDLDVVALLEAL